MLRTTTTATARAFKLVQVSAVARRSYTTTEKFQRKEKAEEDQYIRVKEAETKKLKEQLAAKEKEIADLKKAKK